MFSGLRQGNLFYILEKEEGLKLKVGQVVKISNPQPRFNQYTQPFGQTDSVVDVSVKIGNETLDFKQLPATQSIANFGQNGVVVSESREAINAEVEAMLRSNRQVIESVPYCEKMIADCDAILRELNPHFAKEKEQEEKIGALEKQIGGIENTLSSMMGMLSKALNKGSSKLKED